MKDATIHWVPVDAALPDDEMTVLVAMEDGEVWAGFHEDGEWRYFDAQPIPVRVTYWAEFPAPPK